MQDIHRLRKKIDQIDHQISKQLKEREKIIIEIGKTKKAENIPLKDSNREEEILSNCDSAFEKAVMKTVLTESKKLQQEL